MATPPKILLGLRTLSSSLQDGVKDTVEGRLLDQGDNLRRIKKGSDFTSGQTDATD
jgi:hypothetical protein